MLALVISPCFCMGRGKSLNGGSPSFGRLRSLLRPRCSCGYPYQTKLFPRKFHQEYDGKVHVVVPCAKNVIRLPTIFW